MQHQLFKEMMVMLSEGKTSGRGVGMGVSKRAGVGQGKIFSP